MLRTGSLLAALTAATLIGCGGGPAKVDVSGTVTKGGKVIPVSKTGYVQVMLVPAEGDPAKGVTTIPMRADEQGNFKASGVLVGKYKVAVELFDPTPTDDRFGGAFGRDRTRILREIKGPEPLLIDLSKPEG